MVGSDGRVLLVSRVRHAGLKSQLPRQPSRYPNTKGAERVSFGRPTCVYLKGSYPLAPSMPRGYYYDQIPCLVCALMSAVAPPDFKARDQIGHSVHSQFYRVRETEHINHSCLEFSLTSVVWTFRTFDDNFQKKHDFTKYLKEIFRISSDEHFSFKFFPTGAFIGKVLLKFPGLSWTLQA